MNLSKYKTSTILGLISTFAFLTLSVVFLLIMNFIQKSDALEYAKEKADIILDKNLSVHAYFNKDLKPSLFDDLKDSIAAKNYFNPAWMSSTYAIIELDKYFNQKNTFGYYYKDAAINARSIRNEADEFELEYLQKINANPNIEAEEGVIEIDNEPYYYLLKKGETLEIGCMMCHSAPENAPSQLVDKYGDIKSFNRNNGEIISIVSIRIPLKEAYLRASDNMLTITIAILVVFVLALFIYLTIQKRIFFNPLVILSKKSSAISNNHQLLGETIDINTTIELSELISSFNKMSVSLYEYSHNLEQKINEKTISLENKIQETILLAKTKERMVSIISHDLRTPFNSLIGFSEMLVQEIQNGNVQKAKEYALVVLNVSNKTFLMLDNLLKWSLSQTNNLGFNPVQLNVTDITEIIELQKNIAFQKQITIILSVQEGLTFFADKNMIVTVLRNLVSNAIKFTDKGGEITITATEVENNTVISVSDNGRGIEFDRIDTIFKQNSRSTSGTDKEEGTGLGLSLCQKFVEKHHGRIWVESEIGKGSKFSFTIPNH